MYNDESIDGKVYKTVVRVAMTNTIEEVGCSGNENAEMDVGSHKAGQNIEFVG